MNDQTNTVAPVTTVEVQATAAPAKLTKKQQATDLYAANRETLSRKELIALFMDRIGVTQPAAASLYQAVQDPDRPCKTTVTKMSQAESIVTNNPEATRKSILQIFQEELQLTADGAKTYYQTIKNSK